MRKLMFDGVNIFYMVCRVVYYDICKIIIKRFFLMVKKIIKNGWNVVYYIIEGDDLEEERMKILYFVVFDFDLNYVIELGEIVFGNV